jgi:hypothetical protein
MNQLCQDVNFAVYIELKKNYATSLIAQKLFKENQINVLHMEEVIGVL